MRNPLIAVAFNALTLTEIRRGSTDHSIWLRFSLGTALLFSLWAISQSAIVLPPCHLISPREWPRERPRERPREGSARRNRSPNSFSVSRSYTHYSILNVQLLSLLCIYSWAGDVIRRRLPLWICSFEKRGVTGRLTNKGNVTLII